MSWLSKIFYKINNFDSLNDKYLNLGLELESVKDDLEDSETTNNFLINDVNDLKEELAFVKEQLAIAIEGPLTELDTYCIDKGYKRKRIAYQNKRKIGDKYVSVFLHELIQPDSYEVFNISRKIDDYTVKGVGTYISKNYTWKSDEQFNPKTKDYYLQPNEFLVKGDGDCEDHAYACASLMPKTLGVAYGFVNLPDGRSFGHAFNVYINNGKLFLLDTVENYAIIKDVSKHYYTINYIVTQKGTYVVDGTVDFGMEAR